MSTDNKKLRNRRIRNALVLTGGVLAVGVGTYFGVKKSFGSLPQINVGLDEINNHLSRMNEYIDYREAVTRNQMNIIDAALEKKIDFSYFPGIGVHSFDMDKIKKVVDKAS